MLLETLFFLTKYVVGAKTNPPKKLRRPPKNGNAIARNMVMAANISNYYIKNFNVCEI